MMKRIFKAVLLLCICFSVKTYANGDYIVKQDMSAFSENVGWSQLSKKLNYVWHQEGSFVQNENSVTLQTSAGKSSNYMWVHFANGSGMNAYAYPDGNYVMEGKFRFAEKSGVYLPLGFTTDCANGHSTRNVVTVIARDGVLYASTSKPQSSTVSKYTTPTFEKICDYNTDMWYTIKVRINSDGNSTTFDTYSYEIQSENTLYTGGPHMLGQPMNEYVDASYAMQKIQYFGFGICYATNSEVPAKMEVEYAAVSYSKPLLNVYSNVENGMTDRTTGDIIMSFDAEINPDTLSAVKLYEISGNEKTAVDVLPVLSVDGKTFIIKESLRYSKEYCLTILQSFAANDSRALGGEKNIYFSTMAAPVAISIENVDISGEISPGEKVNAAIEFVNSGIVLAEDAVFVAALYDGRGAMRAVTSKLARPVDGERVSLKFGLKIPPGIDKDAFVQIYVLSSMWNGSVISEKYIYKK